MLRTVCLLSCSFLRSVSFQSCFTILDLRFYQAPHIVRTTQNIFNLVKMEYNEDWFGGVSCKVNKSTSSPTPILFPPSHLFIPETCFVLFSLLFFFFF